MSFEAKNLSFQLVDVGQGLLSGQSAMMIFAQQAGQIGQIIGTSNKGLGGLLKEVGASLRGLLTPATVAVGGLAALGVGAYAAYQSWKTFALQLDDTAHIAGTTSSAMAKLQAAASFKGIGQDDFAKGMGGFSQQIYLAKQNMGGLIDVLRANGVSAAGDFTTLLGKAADLIKNASSDQQRLVLLQQMGLPATMEWLRLLQGGAAGIKNATDAAVEFGGAANDNLVKKAREADEAWNHFWTNFGQKAKQYTVDAAGGISDFIDRVKNAQLNVQLRGTRLQGATPLGTDFDAFYKATGADRPNGLATLDKDKVRNDIALAQTRLGPLGQTPTVKELAVPDQSPQRKAA
ncbi:MAG: phage tail length tape measure family protein [Rhizobiales bacterium]|nr:phage tail length tape measure family protein [Hyphomicrobiales bacterium]